METREVNYKGTWHGRRDGSVVLGVRSDDRHGNMTILVDGREAQSLREEPEGFGVFVTVHSPVSGCCDQYRVFPSALDAAEVWFHNYLEHC